MARIIVHVPRFRHGRRRTGGASEPVLVPRPYPSTPARMAGGLSIEAVSGLRDIQQNTTPATPCAVQRE